MPQIVSVCTTTCRSRVFWQSLLSFKTQHIRAKPGRRCVGRPASEARPGAHTPRPKAEHGCADPPSPPHFLSEIAAHASLSRRTVTAKRSLFKTTGSFFTVFTETFWHFPSKTLARIWSFPPPRLSPAPAFCVPPVSVTRCPHFPRILPAAHVRRADLFRSESPARRRDRQRDSASLTDLCRRVGVRLTETCPHI